MCNPGERLRPSWASSLYNCYIFADDKDKCSKFVVDSNKKKATKRKTKTSEPGATQNLSKKKQGKLKMEDRYYSVDLFLANNCYVHF